MRVQDDDGQALINEIESKRGGQISWRTFSTWYADTEGNIRERGVFLYVVNGVFWYEDFEVHPNILGIEVKPRKNTPPYVKYEDKFQANQVKDMYIVSKKAARDFAEGYSSKLPRANFFDKWFSQTVTAVEFKDSSMKFFEVFGKDFENKVKELSKEN